MNVIRMCGTPPPAVGQPVTGWTVREPVEPIRRTWRPELPDNLPWNVVTIPAGSYVLCPTCVELVDAGRIGDLAAHRADGQPGTEDTAALMAIVGAFGEPVPLATWWTARNEGLPARD